MRYETDDGGLFSALLSAVYLLAILTLILLLTPLLVVVGLLAAIAGVWERMAEQSKPSR